MPEIRGRYILRETLSDQESCLVDLRLQSVPSTDGWSGRISLDRFARSSAFGRNLDEHVEYLEAFGIALTESLEAGEARVELSGRLTSSKTSSRWHRARYKLTIFVDRPDRSATLEITPSASDIVVCTGKRISERLRSLEVLQDRHLQNGLIELSDFRDADRRFIRDAFAEAGVEVTFSSPARSIRVQEAKKWTRAGLHRLMEDRVRQWPETEDSPFAPWRVWGLLTNRYEESDWRGYMFDHSRGSGPTPDPYRQGFAVFLDAIEESTGGVSRLDQARLRVGVHEIGHCLNLVHPFHHGPSDSTSWMNSPEDYSGQDGKGPEAYWGQYPFRFSREELEFLAHAPLDYIEPGRSDLREHSAGTDAGGTRVYGGHGIELKVRPRSYYDFLEPISLELRLRNLTPTERLVDHELGPEFVNVALAIQRPNGQVRRYEPLGRVLFRHSSKAVMLGVAGSETDRWSREFFAFFDRRGFCFDEPGPYKVWARYRGPGGIRAVSRPASFRIRSPRDRREERLACDLFSPQVGRCLYFDGLDSPSVRKGRETILSFLERKTYENELVATRWAERMARGELEELLGAEEDGSLVVRSESSPGTALHLSEPALQCYRKTRDPGVNIADHRLVRLRARCHQELGCHRSALDELRELEERLGGTSRGVRPPVLAELRSKIGEVQNQAGES